MPTSCPRCGLQLEVAAAARKPAEVPADRDRFDTVRRIQRETAELYGFTAEQITSHQRNARLCLARHVAMHRAARITGLSLQQLAGLFKRDHTTIVHAVQRISGLIAAGEHVMGAHPDA